MSISQLLVISAGEHGPATCEDLVGLRIAMDSPHVCACVRTYIYIYTYVLALVLFGLHSYMNLNYKHNHISTRWQSLYVTLNSFRHSQPLKNLILFLRCVPPGPLVDIPKKNKFINSGNYASSWKFTSYPNLYPNIHF